MESTKYYRLQPVTNPEEYHMITKPLTEKIWDYEFLETILKGPTSHTDKHVGEIDQQRFKTSTKARLSKFESQEHMEDILQYIIYDKATEIMHWVSQEPNYKLCRIDYSIGESFPGDADYVKSKGFERDSIGNIYKHETTDFTVFLKRDDNQELGFYIETAYPNIERSVQQRKEKSKIMQKQLMQTLNLPNTKTSYEHYLER